MIKINLLHAKKVKGKVGGRKDIIISILAVVCLLGVLGMVQWRIGKEKEDTFAKIQKTKEDINTIFQVFLRQEQQIMPALLNLYAQINKTIGTESDKIVDSTTNSI